MQIITYEINQKEPNYLAKRDEEFIKIQNLIDIKRKYLIEKKKKLKHISKQNRFLDEVRNDYNRYFQYIEKQKQDQIMALNTINKYIDDLTYSGELSKKNIIDAKEEQRKILKEIKDIKNSLDAFIDDTDKPVNDVLNSKNNILNNSLNKTINQVNK
jgi:hypothetical protein